MLALEACPSASMSRMPPSPALVGTSTAMVVLPTFRGATFTSSRPPEPPRKTTVAVSETLRPLMAMRPVSRTTTELALRARTETEAEQSLRQVICWMTGGS